MFKPTKTPRVFSQSIGVDFFNAFVAGLLERTSDKPPEYLATIEIFVNTTRAARRLKQLFIESGACLLPRIRLITDLANDPLAPISLPKPVPALRRRLQLGQLVQALIKSDPSLAPQSAAYDLADALAALMDEFQGEAVPLSALEGIVLENQSEHWNRSLKFLQIIATHWTENARTDPNDRQHHVAQAYADYWRENPPNHPIIVAGSTGSRGHTALFMEAVANLPLGAIVLPGFDKDMPTGVWQTLCKSNSALDHPQAGFAKLLTRLKVNPADIDHWHDKAPFNIDRNELVSLALRPAPVTDQWRKEGKKLSPNIYNSTINIDFIEAKSPKEEALAIAVRLRKAAEDGVQSVLITPDRNLTRRVETALGRWGIIPDDSAGQPLDLSPPGVFLRLAADVMGQKLSPQRLLAILKHPLTHSGGDRGEHQRRISEIELKILRGGDPEVNFDTMRNWAQKLNDPASIQWVAWLESAFKTVENAAPRDLTQWIHDHQTLAQTLSRGADKDATGALWDKEAGIEAGKIWQEFSAESKYGGILNITEYRALLRLVLSKGEIRGATQAHPLISIWGTMEARVQGSELVILGGLNEGIWPKTPSPDPWLNRNMRGQIGLALPDRQIGLSAHDFQLAIGSPNVVLSRAIRDNESPTVASRWMIRLSNLIKGIDDESNAQFQSMQSRGNHWIAIANAIDRVENTEPRATRPSPMPPASARPDRLSVTEIKNLVRDPYAIYAKHVLGLRKLDDVGREPDALVRGISIHTFLENYVSEAIENKEKLNSEYFINLAESVLAKEVPWPAMQRLWLARLQRVAQWFVEGEVDRQKFGTVIAQERRGKFYDAELDFTLSVQADRIDMNDAGNYAIYDYKAGKPPTAKSIADFDKQLQLEAAIAGKGKFDDLGSAKVVHLEYIGMHQDQETREIPIDSPPIDQVWEEFRQLISNYKLTKTGFTARDKLLSENDFSDYDHLSRKGEWELTDDPDPKEVP
ncbi:double-strand break repair protein AddB [Amylibacter kogurei]|uniref:Double-strand break repair protein AddB n=1 Tax=Paramylibacter kogurei TaxID=1889778 RepID=A0A2G5KBG6_9RHOB|nr:double-strand break repair protein AddB [Amylibacter kogurei]PIB26519.1 double-strand break repair protein AddB [Amylibacter kogurei]